MTNLPRVLIVSATPLQGSWATSRLMHDLFDRWPRASLRQITVTRPGSDPDLQPIESLYLDGLDGAGARDPRRVVAEVRRVLRFVRAARPDVVYFRSAGWPMLFELVPLVLRRHPVVTHIMDDWPEQQRLECADRSGIRSAGRRIGAASLRRILGRSAVRMAISDAMASAFSERYGAPFEVVHAGTDRLPPPPSPPPPPPSPLSSPPSPRPPSRSRDREATVFYSGSIASDQTADSLVRIAEAIQSLDQRSPGVRFHVAPSSPMPGALRAALVRVGAVIGDQTTAQDYHRRLAAADVVVATANFDPRSIAFLRYSMPNKLPDLLASGSPVLIVAPADLAYVRLAEQDGWAVVESTGDRHAIELAVETLLDDHEVRTRLVQAAERACSTTFFWPSIRDRFEDAIRRAVPA